MDDGERRPPEGEGVWLWTARRARAAEAADGFCLGAWASSCDGGTATVEWGRAAPLLRRHCFAPPSSRIHAMHPVDVECYACIVGGHMHAWIYFILYIGFLHYPCIGCLPCLRIVSDAICIML